MTRIPVLSKGLKRLPEPRQLEPGEIVITRFKNSLRKYKSDLWVGVVIPRDFGPSRHLNRRPSTAQPIDDGPWLAHLKDRMYPLYLPGLNMYRYSGLEDIFVLEDQTPNIFKKAKREGEAKVWGELMHIIKFAPNLDWWLDMAQQELGSKGKRGRELRIVLPCGSEHFLDDYYVYHDDDQGSDDETRTENGTSSHESTDVHLPNESDEALSHVEQPDISFEFQAADDMSTTSNAITRQCSNASDPFLSTHESFAFNESSCFPSQVSSLRGLSTSATPLVPGSHLFQPFRFMNRGMAQSFSRKQSPEVDESVTKKEDTEKSFPGFDLTNRDTPASVPVQGDTPGNGNRAFDMSVRKAFQQVFLNTAESSTLLGAFHGIVQIQHTIEFQKIQSFLRDREFCPRLIQFHNPSSTSESAISHQIGDLFGIGRIYRLDGMDNPKDLVIMILDLGKLYEQARCFELADLIHLIAMKLQVAWNSYPSLVHLKALLKIVPLVFANSYDESTLDILQKWMLHFFAESYDLFAYDCSDAFWSTMRANSGLQDAVNGIRSKLVSGNPELYSDPLALIRSRGITVL
ncbi:uncharacterized protein N7511_010923 [Penicillium nucicola]|uniref:uncharacterized protein n=1 Tax=Penicillium nucicola TaxID=1850975 RepID=UPI002545971A|nr:uncharacterized protein N7511_010923 [Penicillium nucicola]KAJ5749227.1 hypothetical protein N7511_010923 [Penicillium nucicola]